MSPCSQHTAHCRLLQRAQASPPSVFLASQNSTESSLPRPSSNCACKGGRASPCAWLGPGGLAVMRKEFTGPKTRYF